jgi:potassium efflux system protein
VSALDQKWLATLSLWLLLSLVGLAQPTATPSPTPTASASPVQPLQVSEIAFQLEETRSLLVEMKLRLRNSTAESQFLRDFEPQASEIDRHASQALRVLSKNPSLAELRDLEADWQGHESDLKGAYDRLTALDTQRGAEQSELQEQSKVWSATATAQASQVPELMRRQIDDLDRDIAQIQQQETDARGRILLSLTDLARAQSRANNILAAVRQARDSKVERVFVRDGVPIWRIDLGTQLTADLPGELLDALAADQRDLIEFAQDNGVRLCLHLFALALLVAGLSWARGRVAPWAVQEPGLAGALSVFSAPVSTALLITACLTPWIYPRAPVLMQVGLATLTLIPAVLVLRQLLAAQFHSYLNALIVLFCLDQVRTLCGGQLLVARLLFWLELLLACGFLSWARPQAAQKRLRTICLALNLILFFALLANLLGYRDLSYWLGDGTIHSADLAVFLVAGVEVVSGLTLLTLRLAPLSLLASIRENRVHFRQAIFWSVQILASLAWLVMTLDALAILWPLSDGLNALLQRRLALGTLSFRVGGLLAALFVLWVSSKLSRFSRTVLELDVYPHLQLEPGVDYTVTTLVRYFILLFGVIFALGAIGVDSTKFTIVAGALSVGIGFGLQNIVNNFVSGLILLFERPVKVGDTIQVAEQIGVLKQVGLRAAVLRTGEGAEVIVPNGQLLSTQVTNWTLSDPLRRLHVDIGVSYDSQPRKVRELLLKTASQCPEVLTEPAPGVLLVELGDSSLNFRVQVWIEHSQDYSKIQSELLMLLYEALQAAKIDIPFPTSTILVERKKG